MTISHDITKEPTAYWKSGNPAGDTLWRHIKEDPHILTDTVKITSAQVKLLRSAPKEIVAAPGADKVIQFINATLILDYGSNVFIESTDNLVIRYTNSSGVIVSESIEMSGFLDQTTEMITNADPKKNAIVLASASVDEALVLYNTGGEEISGNAGDDNVLIVKISYIIHDAGLA